MSERPRRGRGVVRSFLFGGVVGGLVAVAAPRVRRVLEPHEGPLPVAGLEAFEGAPCWEHDRGLRVGAEPGDDPGSII
ncbi:MAG: hypothetical protein QOJ31_697 [Gaiellales bacterium]|jgi:hypothetical protein|nr:hypothetical protein [Gaiellales bacterium]MDX6550013.1 hypothetical protein [Gaiellales bacterium]